MSYGARARVAVASLGKRIGSVGSAISSFGKRIGHGIAKAITRFDRYMGVPPGRGIVEMMNPTPVKPPQTPAARPTPSTPFYSARSPPRTGEATTLSGRKLTREEYDSVSRNLFASAWV